MSALRYSCSGYVFNLEHNFIEMKSLKQNGWLLINTENVSNLYKPTLPKYYNHEERKQIIK